MTKLEKLYIIIGFAEDAHAPLKNSRKVGVKLNKDVLQ